MNRIILTTIILFVAGSLFAQDTDKEIKSEIESVVVFLNGAQVSRTAATTIPAGTQTLKLVGLTADLDPQSVQVEGEGNFTILSVSHQLDYLKAPVPKEEIQQLIDQKEALNKENEFDRTLLGVLAQEQALFTANQKIGGQQNGVPIAELQATAEFYRTRIREMKEEELAFNRKIKERGLEITQIDLQLRELSVTTQKVTSEIEIITTAKTATRGEFTVSYLVRNAGWLPTYDLRVKDVKSPVELTYKARVYQASNEDWKDVKLTLSTGDPRQRSTKPELGPWYLRFVSPSAPRPVVYGNTSPTPPMGSGAFQGVVRGRVTDENGEGLIGATVVVRGTTVGTVTDEQGNYSLNVPAGHNVIQVSYIGYNRVERGIGGETLNIAMASPSVTLDEVVITSQEITKDRVQLNYAIAQSIPGVAVRTPRAKRVEQIGETLPLVINQVKKATNVEFKIEEPYSIPSDGKVYLVEIKQHDLKATYRYFCAPKLDLNAYLTAQVIEWEGYNLLEAEAQLFFEGTYVGKTLLNVREVNDTLDISLGRDRDIIVSRTKLTEFNKNQFIGGNRKETRAWEIEVSNKKKEDITLIVEDQFPVSTDNRIEIDQISKSGARLDENTGILTWELDLKAGEDKKFDIRYSVKYPKELSIELE